MLVQTPSATFSAPQEIYQPGPTGQETIQPGSTGQELSQSQPSTSGFSDLPVSGAYRCPPELDTLDFDLPQSDAE